MLVGSHLSIAGGMHLAVETAVRLGLDCVQVFTKNQRQWKVKPLADDEVAAFRAAVKAAGWDRHPERRLVSHNSYLVNLASPDAASRAKSRTLQLEETERCERLGIPSCVMHPGAHLGTARDAKDEAAGVDEGGADDDEDDDDIKTDRLVKAKTRKAPASTAAAKAKPGAKRASGEGASGPAAKKAKK